MCGACFEGQKKNSSDGKYKSITLPVFALKLLEQ